MTDMEFEKYFIKLLSAIILLVNCAQASPIPEKPDRNGIFKLPLHQNDFVENLKNPCRAKVDPFEKVNPSKSNPVLVISGRENDIRVITGNMKSRLGFVKKHLVSKYIICILPIILVKSIVLCHKMTNQITLYMVIKLKKILLK